MLIFVLFERFYRDPVDEMPKRKRQGDMDTYCVHVEDPLTHCRRTKLSGEVSKTTEKKVEQCIKKEC